MHMMIDLETMSLSGDAAIVQIGAVMFDPTTGELGEPFNLHVALDDAEQGHIDPRTVRWWLKQSEAARAALEEGQEDAGTLDNALFEFKAYYLRNKPEAVWSHGATFDIPILASAFERLNYKVPWGYRDARDTRTLFALTGKTMEELYPRQGTHHNALDDAKSQALAVAAAYCLLRNAAS